MTNPNLKIPFALLQKYHLSFLAVLLYGELNGLYTKFGKCEITDTSLSKRLNRSISGIRRGLTELKDSGLIKSKQKPNYKGRNITVTKLDDKKFILIPIAIIRRYDLSLGALLVYGSIYSRIQKQIKINQDKRINDVHPSITVTKSELAKQLNKTGRFIGIKINELENHGYIIASSIKGKGIEIATLPTNSKVGTKRVATYEQNEHPHRNKTSIHVGTKLATNRTFNKIINKEIVKKQSSLNKDSRPPVTALEEFLSDPFHGAEQLQDLTEPPLYDFLLPEENDIPPEEKKQILQ